MTIKKIGEAYAFFKCGALKADIEKELPFIRKLIKTPAELELILSESANAISKDASLLAKAKEVYDAGANFALKGSLPNKNNEPAAEELSSILNQAHESLLYEPNTPLIAAIYYKNAAGEYKLFDEEGYVS